MRAPVVYESLFDNTQVIADSIAAGLRDSTDAEVVAASDAPSTVPGEVGLLAALATDLRLRRLGMRIASPPQSFYVAQATGSSLTRETERARSWARWIAAGLPGMRQRHTG